MNRHKMPRPAVGWRIALYIFTLLMAAMTVLQLLLELFIKPVEYAMYLISAVALTASVYYIIGDIKYIRRKAEKIIHSNKFTDKFITDYRYRTLLTSVPNFALNVIFALFNGIVGIVSRSVWYGSIALYYLLLCAMRWGAMLHVRSDIVKKEPTQIEREISTYRHCGELLMAMSIALGAIVMLITRGEGTKTYPGFLIYVVAIYTFWKVIMSAINLAKSRKTSSPLLMTLRNIGHADALVSILSLETAMLAEFGMNESAEFIGTLLTITGIAVCVAVLIIGITMVIGAVLRKKNLEKESENG